MARVAIILLYLTLQCWRAFADVGGAEGWRVLLPVTQSEGILCEVGWYGMMG